MLSRRSLLLASGAAAMAPAALPFAGSPAAAQTPPGVLVFAKQIDDIISLDPHEAFEYTASELAGNVYQKLVTTPNSNPSQIEGELAEKWEVSGDSKTFTFTLKDGPKFASGKPVTAEDVAFSLTRAVVMNKSPAFIINQFGFNKDNVGERIRATGPRTLVLQTAESTAPSFLLYCLSAAVGSVVEKAAVMAKAQGDDWGNGWLKQNSAGSGSYAVRQWRASESVVLEANPHSNVAPQIKRIIMRHIADPSAQLLGLTKGDYDIARNLGADQIRQLEGDSRYTVQSARKASVMYLSLNQKNANLAKPEVRQAIKLALDYEGIQKAIVPTTYAVHQSFLPAGLPGALTEHPFKRNVAEAKALLAKAGLAEGFELGFDYSSAAPFSDIAQAVQANLAEIGIRLRMLPGEQRAVITKTRARTHDIAMVRWGSDYFDPHSNAEAFSINTDNSDDARNRTLAWRASWLIPELSARTVAALKETDAAKRTALYEALQRDHQQQSPFVIMLQDIEISVSRAGVKGFDMGPMNDRHSYTNITKA
ncbi:ABC transporter substrate-binding protein [Teichococcus aestuarii]|uniref:Peptide ABC transporter substrate-binding protein n=1 Tax=Teichococcus aestuarii TaxID=568898 RepID=A0A2U1V079_9PROT|nr:ABC transporter substrate-binding protein [Pseudoroseomonas aestuarii]PWC27308.1 peptide ABC transporter substrate-binding protein [Pseudoroseomonas aestuarii]